MNGLSPPSGQTAPRGALPQMPPIGDLHRVQRSPRAAVGITASAVPVALALGGRAGARLTGRLAADVSRMTLIRLIRALPDPTLTAAARNGCERRETCPHSGHAADGTVVLVRIRTDPPLSETSSTCTPARRRISTPATSRSHRAHSHRSHIRLESDTPDRPGRGTGVAPGPSPRTSHRTRRVPLNTTGSPLFLPSGWFSCPGAGDLAAAVAVPGNRNGRDRQPPP
jgi:hypothetical protein